MMTGNKWKVQRPVQKRTLESTEITGDWVEITETIGDHR